MRKSLSGIVCTVGLVCIATVYAHEALAQARPDTRRQVPKMLVRPQLKEVVPASVKPGDKIIAYEMAWQVREPKAVARRFAGALDVLLGKDAARKVAGYEALNLVVEGDEAGSWVRIRNTPILAKYQREYDEIRLIHEELDVINNPADDIGEDGARKMAEAYLKRLAENGVIDSPLYAQATMQLGYKMVGEGSVNGEVKPGRIVEYRITFRPRLNGIEMVNAGVRLSILTSGQLASLRLGGVTPAGEWQEGVLKSRIEESVREVRVSTKELMDRFYRKVPKEAEAQIAWSRVMYVMPEGKEKAVVEPMLLVSYTELRKIDGQRVASRRKTLAYSLTDPDAAPVDLDAPVSKHEGTETTRKR